MNVSTGSGHLIGHAQVSTVAPDAAAQIDALQGVGCVRVFTDHATGTDRNRPQLAAALDHLNAGDTLVVWRLDRLGRSMTDLLAIVTGLGERGVDLMSVTEAIDTSTPAGRLVFHLAGAFSQFERDLIRDRTVAGPEAARSRGRVGGRPPALGENDVEAMHTTLAAGMNQRAVARTLKVAPATVDRALLRTQECLT
ncbi:recombinase family protein [Galactobacter caseinivorans]|uniref:Recombinase family protein n=1 Tax=Galactobacter caseinivorans TaxID=2676123 RepID=A0A496PMB8_9MICC|nr:recombinase family protein [Galactobacter caseinivorans]RKW71682.1 recombinase family protein [Galactobacter caseinivorans]